MRVLRSLTLLLVLVAPTAFADRAYQVELILFRQHGQPATTEQASPEDWSRGASLLADQARRNPALGDLAQKLDASGEYQVLLHRAWQQDIGTTPGSVALADGHRQFGHYPIEGVLTLSLARFTDIDADFYVNRLDEHGVLLGSERVKQATRVRNGELTYVDSGSLALLIKVSPL